MDRLFENIFMGLGVIVIAWLAYPFVAFLALLMTGVAILCWNRPRKILGGTVYPVEARRWIYGGLSFSVLLPAFVAFYSLLMDQAVRSDMWHHFAIAGYAYGAFLVDHLASTNEAEAQSVVDITPNQSNEVKRISPPVEPFRFSTWDDEERGS